jgi:hypothetical protein
LVSEELFIDKPYGEEIYQIYLSAEGDPRRMLEDGEINAEDVIDIKNLFSKCLKEKGYLVIFSSNGNYSVKPDSSQNSNQKNEALNECEIETLAPDIIGLWGNIQMNPDNRNMTEIQLECLIKTGIYPENTQLSEFEYDMGLVDGYMHGPYYRIHYSESLKHFKYDEKTGSSVESEVIPPDRLPTAEEKKLADQCDYNPLGLDLDE